jgi:hypothetical protein
LCFCHCLHLCGLMYSHLHLCGWLYFHLNNFLLPYIRLCCLCFHKSYSTILSSSNSSMNIVSINVALGLIYSFAC